MTNLANAPGGAVGGGRQGFFRGCLRDEAGQTFVEYTLVILLVAVAIATGALVEPFREAIASGLGAIGDAINGAVNG